MNNSMIFTASTEILLPLKHLVKYKIFINRLLYSNCTEFN